MRIRTFAVVAAAVGVAALPAATATAGSPARATGGGQFVTSGDNTIGFSAIGTSGDNSGPAKGQLNVVDHSGSTHYHGDVTCLNVQGNMAIIEGVLTMGQPGRPFRLVVTDNGEGSKAMGADMIAFEPGSGDGSCSANNNDNQMDLAHGNVQVVQANTSASGKTHTTAKRHSVRAAGPGALR